MYKFRDLSIAKNDDKYIPSYAMKLINGSVPLETFVPGYLTTKVTGREEFSPRVETYGVIPGRDGILIKDRTVKERYIEIEYTLECKDNKEYRDSFNNLNGILYGYLDEKQDGILNMISFMDEPDVFYRATFYSREDIDTSTNTAKGKITLMCQDPYKYSKTKEITDLSELEESASIPNIYPIMIEDLSFDVPEMTGKIEVISKGRLYGSETKKIVLNIENKPGQKISIKNKKVYLNGKLNMSLLDFMESDLKYFEIYPGDKVRISPDVTNIKLKYRSRLL